LKEQLIKIYSNLNVKLQERSSEEIYKYLSNSIKTNLKMSRSNLTTAIATLYSIPRRAVLGKTLMQQIEELRIMRHHIFSRREDLVKFSTIPISILREPIKKLMKKELAFYCITPEEAIWYLSNEFSKLFPKQDNIDNINALVFLKNHQRFCHLLDKKSCFLPLLGNEYTNISESLMREFNTMTFATFLKKYQIKEQKSSESLTVEEVSQNAEKTTQDAKDGCCDAAECSNLEIPPEIVNIDV
jgi:hypothetical protein